MPPTAHHFTPLWPLHEPQQSYRFKQYAPTRKRKRHLDHDHDSDSQDSDQDSFQASVQSHDITDPYRVAGWPQNLPLPDASFPHASASKPKRPFAGPSDLPKQLANLKPPLYTPIREEQDTVSSLRLHHLDVLTTILHKSLLRNDFVRAGRAWGMILRTDILGRPFDVRTHGRWGIGAEILLRKFSEDDPTNNHKDGQIWSNQGFEAAKDYYERLILQHPYQKTNPHAISSLTFYPAMFGLCIYEIQQKCKTALERLEQSSPEPDHSELDDSRDEDSEAEGRLAIKRSELESAQSLASRMDELMLSPPFDTNPSLLQLRISMALWLVDLHNAMIESGEDKDEHEDRTSTERAKAKKCLARMKAEGAEVPEILASSLD